MCIRVFLPDTVTMVLRRELLCLCLCFCVNICGICLCDTMCIQVLVFVTVYSVLQTVSLVNC